MRRSPRESCVCARGAAHHRCPCASISRDASASSKVRLPPLALSSLWRRGGHELSASLSTLSRPGKFARGSDSLVKFPSGHRAALSPVPGTLLGRGVSGPEQLAPTSPAFRPRPADATASRPWVGSGLHAQDHSGPRPSRHRAVDAPAVALFLAPFHSRGYI